MSDNSHILIFGGILVDQYARVDRLPDRGSDTIIEESFFRVGGCSINVGTTLRNLGLNPHIVSMVGDDAWGRKIRSYLEQKGFSELAIRYAENESSGYCISIVERDGERTFLTYKGCEAVFDSRLLDRIPYDRVSHVYLTGYYLLEPRYTREMIEQLKKLKDAGAYLVFDPGPLAAAIPAETLLAVLALTDLLIPNEKEWELLAAKFNWGGRCDSRCRELGIGCVVLKQGEHGVEVRSQGEFFRVEPYRVDAVDTTGAGDSFAGGLLYGLSQGFGLRKAVQIASACGALTATIMGPHGDFTWTDIRNMMEKARGETP